MWMGPLIKMALFDKQLCSTWKSQINTRKPRSYPSLTPEITTSSWEPIGYAHIIQPSIGKETPGAQSLSARLWIYYLKDYHDRKHRNPTHPHRPLGRSHRWRPL